MWWWNFGVPAVVGALYLSSTLRHNHQRLQLWQEAMAQCQVTEEKSTSYWAWWPKLTARSGAIEVRITEAKGRDQVEVMIEGAEGFSILKLRRQILKLWEREIEIGDEELDKAFLVDGPLRTVGALLDATLRRQLLRVHSACSSFDMGDGQLRVEIFEQDLPHILPLLLDISRQLAKPVDVEPRIAENARRDPQPGVRLFNLLLLTRERPGDPDTLRALRRACSDESPKVRLRAAIELGEEGRKVLVKLAEESTDDASGAQAVSHLGSKLPIERVRISLSRALNKGLVQTARACLEVLGERGAAAVDTLAKVMTREKGELAAAAALALGKTGEPAAEAPLLRALQSEDSELREAAATALGHAGTVAAVPLLKEAAEGSVLDLGLRRATRQAIAGIQARLHGASPGQLSLAEDEAGQLSLAPHEGGELSLAPHATEPLPPSGQPVAIYNRPE